MAKIRNKKNSRMIFWIQLMIAVILITTMSVGLLQFGGSGRGSSTAPEFPPWIAGLKIIKYVSGEDAKKQMNTLSEERTALRDAWMALYAESAVVWIGQATSESEANRLLDVMRKKAQDAVSDDPDLKLLTANRKGLSVYIMRLREKDTDYFYQKDDKVFWVTLPSGKEEPFISEVMDKLN